MSEAVRTTLLNAATATGDGPEFDNIAPMWAVGLQLVFTGAPSQVVVSLKGLIDGTTYDTIAVVDTAQGYVSGEMLPLTFPIPVRRVKCNLATLSGGSSPTVTAYFAGRT